MVRQLAALCAVLLFTTTCALHEENVHITASSIRSGVNSGPLEVSLYFAAEGEYEYESYDGWYNNPAHPDWGGAGKRKTVRMLHLTCRCLFQICLWSVKYPSITWMASLICQDMTDQMY